MLTIALQRIEFDGRHGATAVERRSTRKFEVDVELEVDAGVAERSDLLADTVDYSRVAEVIVAVGTGEPHHLLESLARQMLDQIRERFPRIRRMRTRYLQAVFDLHVARSALTRATGSAEL